MADMNYPVARPKEDRMDVRALIEVLIRRRWVILMVSLPVVLVAVIGTLRSTQMFQARTTLMIETSSRIDPTFYRQSQNPNIVLASAAELAMSAPVAAGAAVALADSLPVLRERAPRYFENVRTVEDLQGILLGGVNSSHVGESNLLNLSLAHPDPGFCLMGARALAESFVDFQISMKQNSPAVSYFTEQMNETQSEIDSLMAVRTVILDEAGLLGMQADLRASFNQIRDLESNFFTSRSRREGLQTRVEGLEAAIARDPDYVPPVSPNEAPSLHRLQGDLENLRAKLLELGQRYTDDSVWVRRLKEQMVEVREEMLVERERYLEGLRIELDQARAVEASFLSARNSQAGALERYPAVQSRIELIDLKLDGLRRLLQSLQHKRGEVRMAANSDMRISDVVLIEEPVLDVPVGRGRKMLYLIISVVLSIAMGLVVAFFVESNDHRIYDRRRAEMYLEVPVLGSLPDTSKPREST